eukprot:2729210-Karenia_brevis.AAC.1
MPKCLRATSLGQPRARASRDLEESPLLERSWLAYLALAGATRVQAPAADYAGLEGHLWGSRPNVR